MAKDPAEELRKEVREYVRDCSNLDREVAVLKNRIEHLEENMARRWHLWVAIIVPIAIGIILRSMKL
jgi:hypothetical protein